jgi:hypothetical protein
VAAAYTTRYGSDVVLFTDQAKGDRPLIGAYFDHGTQSFYPATWLWNGRYRDDRYTSIDLVDYSPVTPKAE